jgi:hypothetical protein
MWSKTMRRNDVHVDMLADFFIGSGGGDKKSGANMSMCT